jgi:hypothetical protein
MASISESRATTQQTQVLTSLDTKQRPIQFQDLPVEIGARILQHLSLKNQARVALVSKEWAALTSEAMRSNLYAVQQAVVSILQPLIARIPEEERFALTQIHQFSLAQEKRVSPKQSFERLKRRFVVIKKQADKQKENLPLKIANILSKSLGIPLNEAQKITVTCNLASCFSREDFYSKLFSKIQALRDVLPHSPCYRELAFLPKLYHILREYHQAASHAFNKKYSVNRNSFLDHLNKYDHIYASALRYLVQECLDLHCVQQVEAMASDVSNNAPDVSDLSENIYQLEILQRIANYYKQRGNLTEALKWYKAIPVQVRGNVHPSLLEIYAKYKEERRFSSLPSIINAMNNTSGAIDLVNRFVADLLEEGYKPNTLLTYVRSIENSDLRTMALGKLSTSFQENGQLLVALMFAQEMPENFSKIERFQELQAAWIHSDEPTEAFLSAIKKQSRDYLFLMLTQLITTHVEMQDPKHRRYVLGFWEQETLLEIYFGLLEVYASIKLSNNYCYYIVLSHIQKVPRTVLQKTQVADKLAKIHQDEGFLEEASNFAREIPDKSVRLARFKEIRNLQRQGRNRLLSAIDRLCDAVEDHCVLS